MSETNEEPAWKIRERKDAEARAKREEREAADAAERAVLDIGIPERTLDAVRSDAFASTNATEALSGGPIETVVLSGGVGCGKSVAAAWWLLAEEYKRGRWMTAARLARFPRYDTEEIGKLFKVKRMVLDDLGDEYMDEKGAYLSLLDELINERHSGKRQTVITTNLTAEDFKARYGARIADRVREGGRFVAVSSPSMRRRA